jgi:hypothetical protein
MGVETRGGDGGLWSGVVRSASPWCALWRKLAMGVGPLCAGWVVLCSGLAR